MKNEIIRPVLALPNNYKSLLLHSCCAPCSCEIMGTLKLSSIDFTIFFFNPNIDTLDEYNLRKEENKKFALKLNIPFYDGDYNYQSWLNSVKGLEAEPERGKRCTKCFSYRLEETAKFAVKNRFKIFTSSLGISRWKDFNQVCECGTKAASKYNLTYWNHNWRKKGGSERMSTISKKENFYRQNYCGCSFAKYNK
jgi:epoxyqueuosine reductase